MPLISFGSNPCRVRYYSQEIVIFREDMMGRMMRNAVRMGDTTAQGADLRKAVSFEQMGETNRADPCRCSSCKRFSTRLISLPYLSVFALSLGISTTHFDCIPCPRQFVSLSSLARLSLISLFHSSSWPTSSTPTSSSTRIVSSSTPDHSLVGDSAGAPTTRRWSTRRRGWRRGGLFVLVVDRR